MLRTHTCGELQKKDIGKKVTLCGWVETVRDHGGIIFIDLRDKYGITQVIFDPSDSQEAWDIAQQTRGEYVILIAGEVEPRPDDMINKKLPTGEIEVRSTVINVLNKSKTPPFPLNDEKAASVQEDLRLMFRYLDLRRPSMQRNLSARHQMLQAVRNYLSGEGFIEVETPIMTRSTPEGARDYLVPNRLKQGTFYALPQAPQQYKQILMVAGMDKYFQIARCFRDEDLRADRQPEFTQIDYEMSFVTPEDIYEIIDGTLATVMEAAGHPRPDLPLPRMSWDDAINLYGSDKPDLRFDMKLTALDHVFEHTEFKVFGQVLKKGGSIKALNVKGLSGVPVRVIENWTEVARECGLGGMAYIRVQEDASWKSPIVKFFSDTEKSGLQKLLNMEVGDLILFAADELCKVNNCLGKLRLLAAEEAGLIQDGTYQFTWVTDFPLFDKNTEGKLIPMHHPFTSVHPDDLELLDTQPEKARAQAYDVVLNGVELGSGSIRIHNPEEQARMFKILRISDADAQALFGHLLKALSYGAPPHGGFAIGYDRLAALMIDGHTIRDIIAFPKNHRGIDLMMDAPSPVNEKQLREVHLRMLESEEQ